MTALLAKARAWVEEIHPHALHLLRTETWLLELDGDAGEALRLAAVLHDIERAFPDADAGWDSARDWDSPAYNRWHQDRCARIASGWLSEQGAPDSLVAEADALIRVHEEGGWREADLLQAADSLSFIETMTPLIRDWITDARTTPESALAKLEHMYERVQVPQARELGRPLIDAALAECRVA
jgi:hypothetical protein